MKYERYALCVVGLLCCLVIPAHALTPGPTDPDPSESIATTPDVALDDDTTLPVVDDFSDYIGDGYDDSGSVLPSDNAQVELAPESVQAVADAVGDAVSEALETADTGADAPTAYASTGISGGYYFVCDCALGTGVKFWIPADFAVDALALDDNGIVNMTNSTVYLMPDPDSGLSDYTIYASRFGHFQYRRTNYDYQDLRVRNITDTNITFLDDTQPRISDQVQFAVLLAVLLLGFLMLVFIKRG